MPWYDDPAKYYSDGSAALSQGDIVVAPTAVLLEDGDATEGIAGPSELGEFRESRVWLASTEPFPAAPGLRIRTTWGLAIVVPHACAMEKQWNERVTELIGSGRSKTEAETLASQADDLDLYITVAPIVLYDTVQAAIHSGIRSNQRLGYFPICAGAGGIPESFADFNRMTTIYHKLAPRSARVGSLSDTALAHMHHALALHFAYRSTSNLKNLEDAIGCTIDEVTATGRAKGKLVVNLILSNGSTITLEASPDKPIPTRLAERPPRN